jgi:hypothetical protein
MYDLLAVNEVEKINKGVEGENYMENKFYIQFN